MSNPYPGTFIDLVNQMPPDGKALDCGSGPRHYPDDRVVSLDGWPNPFVDVVSDIADMPFDDDHFDLILSQAVLEHVKNPHACAQEMTRVLKPGGLIYIEVAFMQPFHAVPDHYFNVTPSGLDLLFGGLEKVQSGVFQGLSYTVEWMGREAGADKVLGERWDRIVAELEEVDAAMSPEQFKRVAGAACGIWRKR